MFDFFTEVGNHFYKIDDTHSNRNEYLDNVSDIINDWTYRINGRRILKINKLLQVKSNTFRLEEKINDVDKVLIHKREAFSKDLLNQKI